MKTINLNCKAIKGFTIIELIMVLILLGILSAVALPRFFATNDFDERVLFDDTLNAIRYAQKLAVATGCQIQFQSTTTSYQVLRDDSCTSGTYTTQVHNPATGELGLNGSESDVSMTATTITFFPLGNASADTTIQVGSKNIHVIAATGFVYAE